MTRSNARELAIHLIYSRCFTKDDPSVIIASRLDKKYYEDLSEENQVYSDMPSSAQKAYISAVVEGVASREEELDALIQRHSVGWDVSRISKLARSIMQLAIFEIQCVEDVPVGVAISEAVRIAKLYDGDDTGAFVNGILGSFARSLSSEVSS